MGSDSLAIPFLEALVARHLARFELIGVFTQPDRRSGRGLKLSGNPVKRWAEERNIQLYQPGRLSGEAVGWLERNDCQLIIVMAYGHILPQEVLTQPDLGALNLHASLLPR